MENISSSSSSLEAELGQMKVVEYALKTLSMIASVLAVSLVAVMVGLLFGLGIRSFCKGKIAKGVLEILAAAFSCVPVYGTVGSIALGIGASLFNRRSENSFDPEPEDRLDVRSKFQREGQEIDDKENFLCICILIGSRLFLIWSKVILKGSKIIIGKPQVTSMRSENTCRELKVRAFVSSGEGIKKIKNE